MVVGPFFIIKKAQFFINRYSNLRCINLMENGLEDEGSDEFIEALSNMTNISIVLNLNNFSDECKNKFKALRPKIVI